MVASLANCRLEKIMIEFLFLRSYEKFTAHCNLPKSGATPFLVN